ncbi:hypothetical protein TRVL_07042 [Trypanosoma vivax]|nr:hypothetical protein TRVL_07042 [Trypanosoma vivax]
MGHGRRSIDPGTRLWGVAPVSGQPRSPHHARWHPYIHETPSKYHRHRFAFPVRTLVSRKSLPSCKPVTSSSFERQHERSNLLHSHALSHTQASFRFARTFTSLSGAAHECGLCAVTRTIVAFLRTQSLTEVKGACHLHRATCQNAVEKRSEGGSLTGLPTSRAICTCH